MTKALKRYADQNPSEDLLDLRASVESAIDASSNDHEFSHLGNKAWAAKGEEFSFMDTVQISFLAWFVLASAMEIPGMSSNGTK